MCPVCLQETALNKTGRFSLHRIYSKDRFSFCPMSGEPVPGAEPNPATEVA